MNVGVGVVDHSYCTTSTQACQDTQSNEAKAGPGKKGKKSTTATRPLVRGADPMRYGHWPIGTKNWGQKWRDECGSCQRGVAQLGT